MGLSVVLGNAMNLKLHYVVADTDRHGNVRYYFRRKHQPKIRLHGEPFSKAFLDQYNRARDGEVVPTTVKRERPGSGTFSWLCASYYASAEFGQLGKSTGHVRRLILEAICLSKNRKEKERGGLPFALMHERHIREIRDEKAEFPEAANNRLKALRQLFGWDSIKQAEHYTRKASQQKRATGAMHLLTRDDGERTSDSSVPLPVGMSKSGTLS